MSFQYQVHRSICRHGLKKCVLCKYFPKPDEPPVRPVSAPRAKLEPKIQKPRIARKIKKDPDMHKPNCRCGFCAMDKCSQFWEGKVRFFRKNSFRLIFYQTVRRPVKFANRQRPKIEKEKQDHRKRCVCSFCMIDRCDALKYTLFSDLGRKKPKKTNWEVENYHPQHCICSFCKIDRMEDFYIGTLAVWKKTSKYLVGNNFVKNKPWHKSGRPREKFCHLCNVMEKRLAACAQNRHNGCSNVSNTCECHCHKKGETN